VLAAQIGPLPIFQAPRQALFDSLQSLMPRRPTRDHVVVIGIGDDAINAEGPWPWPRDRQAALIAKVLSTHPAVVGFDGFWAGGPARDDNALIAALAAGPVVAGLQGDRSGPAKDYEGPLTPVRLPGGVDVTGRLPAYPAAAASKDPIDAVLGGRGVISVKADDDDVFRRYALLSNIDGRVAPSLALEMLRLAAGAQLLTLIEHDHRLSGVAVGDTTIPVAPDGAVQIDYEPRELMKVCSAEAIVPGRGCRTPGSNAVEPLDGRFVLIGLTAPALEDQQRRTPLAGLRGAMPGVEIHAQALENLISGKLAGRAPWADRIEPALTLTVGLILILVLPRASLVARGGLVLGLAALLAGGGALLWRDQRLLLDVATPAIGAAAVMVAMVGGGLVEADAQRRRLRAQLDTERIAAARAEGEMQAGRIIQLGILPKPEGLGADARFELDAIMIAARQIGGDLYDFFRVGPDRLFIAVGDVSGKGLPASLFMALGKALCKSCALRGEDDIGAIVRTANAEISRDNPEMLFITLFAGILDLDTGTLEFCNAGHDAPFLLRPGEAPGALTSVGGPPLCVADDFPYQTETWRLAPGDLICLTTDGVTEAMTAGGRLIGRERIERMLAALRNDATPAQVTSAVMAEVSTFVAGAEPSDDITILTLRWRGPNAP